MSDTERERGEARRLPRPRKHIKAWYLTSAEVNGLVPHAKRIHAKYMEIAFGLMTEKDLARVKLLGAYLDQLSPASANEFMKLRLPLPMQIRLDVVTLLFGEFRLRKRKKSKIPYWIYPVIDKLRMELAGPILWKILCTCTSLDKLEQRLRVCQEHPDTIRIPLDSAIKIAQKLLRVPAALFTLKAGWHRYEYGKLRPSW